MTAADVVNEFYGALAKGEPATAFALLSTDVTWIEAEGFIYGGTYHGPQDVAAHVFARLSSEWEGFTAIPDSIVGQDDTAVAIGWYTGTYKATGRALRARYVHVFTVADGRIVGFEQIVDSALVADCVKGG